MNTLQPGPLTKQRSHNLFLILGSTHFKHGGHEVQWTKYEQRQIQNFSISSTEQLAVSP